MQPAAPSLSGHGNGVAAADVNCGGVVPEAPAVHARCDAFETSLPAAVEEKRRVAYKPTTQTTASAQRASDQITITQASRTALLQQKRVEATHDMANPSQATDEALQAAFQIIHGAHITNPADQSFPSDMFYEVDEVVTINAEDDVEVMQQVYTHTETEETPFFQEASSMHTPA